MRHVDDAHDPEGDGQPGRGQQQHRTEADAVIDVLEQTPELQLAGRCRGSPSAIAAATAAAAPAARRAGCAPTGPRAPPDRAPPRAAPGSRRYRISRARRRPPVQHAGDRRIALRCPAPVRSAAAHRDRPIGKAPRPPCAVPPALRRKGRARSRRSRSPRAPSRSTMTRRRLTGAGALTASPVRASTKPLSVWM